MSNLRVTNFKQLWLIAAVLFLRTTCELALGVEPRNIKDCSSRYEQKVADLLGCCGDVVAPYGGTDIQRANEALAEINAAFKEKCLSHSSAQYFELLLDQAGAHLMRARSMFSLRASTGEQVVTALEVDDAREAARLLEAFALRHPAQAVLVWRWIAGALQRAGDPWAALRFLSSLPPKCYSGNELDEIRGELLFELGMFGEAAKSYTKWIEWQFPTTDEADQSSDSTKRSGEYCGDEKPLNDSTVLRKMGFHIPEVVIERRGVCEVLGSDMFYVTLPASGQGAGEN